MPNTTQFFGDGEQYAAFSSVQASRAQVALCRLTASTQKTGAALDLGCGDGKITDKLKNTVCPQVQVIGIDKSRDMVRTATRRYSRDSHLSFIEGDVTALDAILGHHCFDLITSFFCLQWVPLLKLPDVLRSIVRHLNPNGEMYLLFPCFDEPHQIIRSVAGSPEFAKYFIGYVEPQVLFDETSVKTLPLEQCFGQYTVNIEKTEHVITKSYFIEYTKQWHACYQVLDQLDGSDAEKKAIMDRFIRAIREKLDAVSHHKEESFTLHQETLHMRGLQPKLEDQHRFTAKL